MAQVAAGWTISTLTKTRSKVKMSKGSKARPFSVDRKTFEENWEKIFSKGKVQTPAKSILDGEETDDYKEKEGLSSEESGSIGVQ